MLSSPQFWFNAAICLAGGLSISFSLYGVILGVIGVIAIEWY